ncbi:hypothetical protein BDZ45DRAFT_45391 [Acephala macrosclerotiorum]|nr:hypothetical protein BDZ45DRAFT_45391 [Acephala macrosclerotiorum]
MTLKCTKGQAAALISHACSCFESAVEGTRTATQTSTTTTTTPITTFIKETSIKETTVAVASATAVVPDLGPICNQRVDFVGTYPNSILNVLYGGDTNACGLSCQQLTGCISHVFFDYYGLCGSFNVPVSELAGGTGLYTFWDVTCPLPPVHVPVCDTPGALQSGTQTPYSTETGVLDQAVCQVQCMSNGGCLSYSIISGACVIYAGYVSQWLDQTGSGTIAWDASCPILPDYCGFTGDLPVAPNGPPRKRTIPPTKTPNEPGTPAPFAEYCWQLCIADSLCVSYTFDPVNLLCAFYSQTIVTIAAIGPTADPAGIQFYDISCSALIYPDPACGVYALTNAATTAAFVTTIAAAGTLNECLANCLYNCLAISFSVDPGGVATCSLFGRNLVAMGLPDTTQTTIWYDSTCPAITPPAPLCAYTADPPSTPAPTLAPFAEYCYQLCSVDPTCASFYFDPVLLQCALYTTSVAVVAPTLDPNGVQ